MPDVVLQMSSYDELTKHFFIPAKSELNKKRIIISTCVNAGKLSALEVNPFTHIFIDEAGQAMEPECLVALSDLVSEDTVCFASKRS